MIKDIMTCASKEFWFYFQSKMIYLVVFVYAAISAGLLFYGTDFYSNTSENMAQFFIYQPGILATIIPVLTMRLWADEYKYNTLEIILTQPIKIAALVWGKFLAAWSISMIMILSSVGMWAIIAQMVSLDNKWILLNYLATFFMAGSLCALSTMAATFCYNAIAAFLTAMGLCVLFVMANPGTWLLKIMAADILPEELARACDFRWQFENMIMGEISLAALVYFGLLIAASLLISLIAVEYKRR